MPKPNKYTPRPFMAGSTHNPMRINEIAATAGRIHPTQKDPDPDSITSIKLRYRCTRPQARTRKELGVFK